MFKYTIDSKDEYTNRQGILMKDLTEGIFSSSSDNMVTFTYYKNSGETEMRPDKISALVFGTDEYTEMIMKYSNVDNPFAMERGDLLMVPTMNSVYNDIIEKKKDNGTSENFDYVKNYHKYIDKNKVPQAAGSDSVNVSVPTSGTNLSSEKGNDMNTVMRSNAAVEANMANNGASGIRIANGRIYFGNNVSVKKDDITQVDGNNNVPSELVDCAKNGVTLGQFLNATIKNSI